MILYHGGSFENLENIIKNGSFEYGYSKNPWSGGNFDGLFCSNIKEYAIVYGDFVIEIEVEENEVEYIQPCPLSEGDPDWRPWMEEAGEYMIPAGVKFKARFV